MAFQYLFAPTTQFQARTGANNTAGFLRVFYTQTDDRAVTYSDFGGTENEADIVLDNDGRAVVIVDDSKTYRLEVYGVNQNLLFTVDPLTAVGGGSGGASITKVISTDGTVGITVTSIGGMVTYDLSTSFEDKPSHWGNAISMISELDGTNDWVQIPTVSSVGTSLYDNGWTADKDTGYDIAASVEMPTGSNNAIYGIDVKCEFQVDGVTVQTEMGRIDPTAPMDRVSFEWKGELTKGKKVDAKLYVKNGEAITLGLVGRALFNEECDGIIGNGSGATEYIPGEYIDISTANVISVTGVQPLSGMSAYAANSALSSYVPNSAFSSYSSTVGNTIVNIENNVSSLSSTVSGLTGTYIEQSASGMFAPSSVETSKLDNSASSTWYPMTGNPSGFLTAVPTGYATTGDVASAVSGKLDTSAYSSESGNFVQNSSFTSYTSNVNTTINNISSSVITMSSDVSGKVDTSSMSSWIPYSALDYSGSAISGIGGSSLAGMGGAGADYTGVYPIVVDNTAREIAVDSLPLITDSTMTSYASGDSSVIGVAPGVFFSSLPVSASAGNDSAVYDIQSAKLRSQYDGVDVMPNNVRLWHNGFSASVNYDAINTWNSAVDTVSSNSASWGALDSATVSAIASGYVTGKQDVSGMSAYAYESSNSAKLDKTAQVVTATATQLYAGTAYLTSVNGAPVSASRAGNAANASLANSAYYDGTGRMISALPDSAAVSSIASGYASGKVDTSAMSSYIPYSALSGDGTSITGISGSAIGGGGATGDYVEKSATEVAIGSDNNATTYSFAQGSGNSASSYSLVQGYINEASSYSLVQGYINQASSNSFAQGSQNKASSNSFAQGYRNSAYADSFTQGERNSANAYSFAQGYRNSASYWSFAQGSGISAKNIAAVFGLNNLHGDGDTATGDSAAFAIGDGTASGSRHDLMVVTKDGEITMYSSTADTSGTGIMSSIRAISAAATGSTQVVTATGSASLKVKTTGTGRTTSTAEFITGINGTPIAVHTLSSNTTQIVENYILAFSPTNSMWTTSDKASGVFAPLQYGTGAGLFIDNVAFRGYIKGNEYFVSNESYGYVRGEVHQTRGCRTIAQSTASAYASIVAKSNSAYVELSGVGAAAPVQITPSSVTSWDTVTAKMDSTAVQSAYASASATQATAQGVLYILIPDGV